MSVNYKQQFLDEHGYGYCEVCSRSDKPMEVHHLYMKSKYGWHKNIDDNKNLILVCKTCHSDFHDYKNKELFLRIENERGLKELFTGKTN